MLAIAAQGALYLSLRHVATAYWPSWAHHHHAPGPLPWPTLVSADIVKGRVTSDAPPALPVPVLVPAPAVTIPVPDVVTGDSRSG